MSYPTAAGASTLDTSPSPSSSCINYTPGEKIIRVGCASATLSDIDKYLGDPAVLHKESAAVSNRVDSSSKGNTWILDAGIVIENDATLYVNSSDTSWLKIIPDEATEVANGIQVHGSLKIDSVRITSWNPETNDYVRYEVEKLIPEEGEEAPYDKVSRPYIRVEEGATGTTDITNSELAYLGYEDLEDNHGRSGLLYYGGDGSIIRGNDIHHNRFGFYSSGVGHITIENNHIHHNYMYGLDPHTGTHDMVIKNNTVHDHGTMGIICSLDCYNVIIEGNEVFNSYGSGIMFSRNMSHSVARYNNVHDEEKCIFVSQSSNNAIYDNKVSGCDSGLYLKHDSTDNKIYRNIILDSNTGILINTASNDNSFHSNTIKNAQEHAINIDESDSERNVFQNNQISVEEKQQQPTGAGDDGSTEDNNDKVTR